MSTPPTPHAGWYPDPEDEGFERRWDGVAWTAERRARPPTAVSQSWWARRAGWQKVLLVAIGVLVILGIAGQAADNTATPAETGTGDTESVAASGAADVDRPGIGEPVRDGMFEFVVTEIVQPGKTYDGPSLIPDEANGTWFVVSLTVENIGDRERAFVAGAQNLRWGGRVFSAENFAFSATNADDLNPGVKIDALVLFDVPEGLPEGGVGVELELHDSAFSRGVSVYP